MAEPYAYFKGEYVPAKDANINILTQAFHYGTAVFGGIKANWDEEKQQFCLFRMKDHYLRQLNACKMLNMHLPLNAQDMADITVEAVRRTGFRETVYCRPLAYKSSPFAGVKLHGSEDDWFVIATVLPPFSSTGGIRCCTSSWTRTSDHQIPTHGKVSGMYVNSALANTEAYQNNFDDAIMLTQAGHVSEGSVTNVFVVIKGQLITPPPSDSILLGITRDTVMQLAKDELGLETVERSIVRSELYLADEVFFSGTYADVVPVIEIDRRTVGTGEPGPLASKLREMFRDVVRGRNPNYPEWYTFMKP
ncbi:MAG: branched-chain amino acid transaminase [Dehalococcoidia bacterium]|nr:branched-chain amino acid transaminase [Dehalococcoidia bacterium]